MVVATCLHTHLNALTESLAFLVKTPSLPLPFCLTPPLPSLLPQPSP